MRGLLRCYGGQIPQCDYERPANANYGGPNGPGYQADPSVCIKCELGQSNSFICGKDG